METTDITTSPCFISDGSLNLFFASRRRLSGWQYFPFSDHCPSALSRHGIDLISWFALLLSQDQLLESSLVPTPVSFQEQSSFPSCAGDRGLMVQPALLLLFSWPAQMNWRSPFTLHNFNLYSTAQGPESGMGVSTCRLWDQTGLTVVVIKTCCSWMAHSVSCENREYWFSQLLAAFSSRSSQHFRLRCLFCFSELN